MKSHEYDIKDIKEELADVMNYRIQMSQVLNVDIVDIINNKMDKTERNILLINQKVYLLNTISYKNFKI